MKTVYYHNITKQKFNQKSLVEFFEIFNEGDVVMFSEYENGYLKIVTKDHLCRIQKFYDDFILQK